MTSRILTQEILKELLDYNLNTGVFTWKPRDKRHFKLERDCKAWNNRFAGNTAKGFDGRGYETISVLCKSHKSHRLAWLYTYGRFPNDEIDHINGKITDNRIVNLRDVDRTGNNRNFKLNKNNKTGKMGVKFDNRRDRWIARIGKKHLGSFKLKQDAINAREVAERKYDYHENHGRVA